MRGGAIALIVVVVLLVAADEGVRRYEEGQVASSIQSALILSARPQVSLRGFPFLIEIAQGQIPSGQISVGTLKEGSLRYSHVHLLLLNLRFSFSQLLRGHLHTVHAVSGIGSASVTQGSLDSFLRAHGAPFSVSFKKGRALTKLGTLSAAIGVSVQISDRTLQISAGSLPTVSIPLPNLLPGLVYGSARPSDKRLILNFRLNHPALDLRS
jgi:LmeA-like phospholipid-binding